MAGLLVTFEGIDRSGKTTQARLLSDALGERALLVREPGGTDAGERVRELLKDPAVEIGARAEALLFAAARAELVARVIRPALEDGRVVISDRYVDSSLAYQGIARGLGVERVLEMNLQAMRGLLPDRTILLLLDPEASAERSGETDRIEREGGEFRLRVDAAYRELASMFPRRILTADGSQAPDSLARLIHGQLRDLS
jgi:dTMP kinase